MKGVWKDVLVLHVYDKLDSAPSPGFAATTRIQFRMGWFVSSVARSITVECWLGIVTEGNRRVVRVAGRLGAAHVPELLTACQGEGALELNLTDLASADNAGVEALQRFLRKGATFVGTPGYIQLKIDALSARQD